MNSLNRTLRTLNTCDRRESLELQPESGYQTTRVVMKRLKRAVSRLRARSPCRTLVLYFAAFYVIAKTSTFRSFPVYVAHERAQGVPGECLQTFLDANLRPNAQNWTDGSIPHLYSTFVDATDGSSLVFTLTTKHIWQNYSSWHSGSWFYDGRKCSVLDADSQATVLFVRCRAANKHATRPLLEVKHKCHPMLANCRKHQYIVDLRTCQNLPRLPFNLVMCTSIIGAPIEREDRVVDWVVYHYLLGFEHFFIYLRRYNLEFRSKLQYLLENAGVLQHVTLFFADTGDYEHVYQQSEQNDCLHRFARNRVRWMANLDIDEFLYKPWRGSLSKYLEEQERAHSHEPFGGLLVQNVFYGASRRETSTHNRQEFNCETSVIECYTSRSVHTSPGREKLILYVANVLYVSVHMVSSGHAPVLVPITELVMNHYKIPEAGPFETSDFETVQDSRLMEEHSELKSLHFRHLRH